jgi:hypothetical protein
VKLGSYMGWFDHWMVRLHNYSTGPVLYSWLIRVVYTRLLNVEGSCNLSTALDSLFHLCPSSLLSYPNFHVLATAPVLIYSISTLYLLYIYSISTCLFSSYAAFLFYCYPCALQIEKCMLGWSIITQACYIRTIKRQFICIRQRLFLT